MLIRRDQYEAYESVILSGQVEQSDMPALLATDPEFAIWYRSRAHIPAARAAK